MSGPRQGAATVIIKTIFMQESVRLTPSTKKQQHAEVLRHRIPFLHLRQTTRKSPVITESDVRHSLGKCLFKVILYKAVPVCASSRSTGPVVEFPAVTEGFTAGDESKNCRSTYCMKIET